MHDYRAQLERLPDGSLRATLYRDELPVRHEWVRSRRRGRRRVADLLCSAIDTDLDGQGPGQPSGSSAKKPARPSSRLGRPTRV